MRILIVEDEVPVAWMLADSLEDAGHEVVGLAATLAEAPALCVGAAAPPELAVLDIDLGDGGSGVDVARAHGAVGRAVDPRQRANDGGAARRARLHPQALRAETVLRSVEVARAVLSGAAARTVPAGLELFSRVE